MRYSNRDINFRVIHVFVCQQMVSVAAHFYISIIGLIYSRLSLVIVHKRSIHISMEVKQNPSSSACVRSFRFAMEMLLYVDWNFVTSNRFISGLFVQMFSTLAFTRLIKHWQKKRSFEPKTTVSTNLLHKNYDGFINISLWWRQNNVTHYKIHSTT